MVGYFAMGVLFPRNHALFPIIGTLWGQGDGVNTFNLPNMSRRTAVGAGGVQLAGPGTAVGNTGGDERLQSHSHPMTHTHPNDGSQLQTVDDNHTHGLHGGSQLTAGPNFPQVQMCNGGFGGGIVCGGFIYAPS